MANKPEKFNFEISEKSLAIIHDAQHALRWLDKDKTWEAWMKVGEGFMELRIVAMLAAKTNRPFGPLYTAVFGRLIQHFKFADKITDSGDRARLVETMEHRAEIEAWRAELTADQRRRWNHPTTVNREWKKAKLKTLVAETEEVSRPPTSRQKLQEAHAEIRSLRKGGHLPWGPNDSPADKARALLEHLSIVEARELGMALLHATEAVRQTSPAPVEPAVEPDDAA